MDAAITVGTVFTVAIGIISYFLKRTMSDIDRHGVAISDIQKNYVRRAEMEQKEKELRDDFQKNNDAILEAIQRLTDEVKDVQVNYINKDDFFKESVRTEQKVDKILDLIIEDRGKRS